MAEPTDAYPEEATKGGRSRATGDGEAALREVLDEHGEELAAALDQTDEFGDLLETVVLLVATADEDEIAYLTDSTSNLIDAADGLSTAEAAGLSADVGANAEELADALELLVALQCEGHLEDLAALGATLSALDVDDDTARGLNTMLSAVGEAERETEPVGVLGLFGELRSRDARAGLGFAVALLKSMGRRMRR